MLFVDFVEELDELWTRQDGPHLDLKVLGSTALFLQTPYTRGTKDSDVIETSQIEGEVRERLVSVAGRSSQLHRRYRIYLDVVSASIPLLPPEPLWHRYPLRLDNFDISFLDAADVVVSKLKRCGWDL